MLYFEDLAEGEEFELGSYTVSEEEIVKFAEKYDPQPFHTDPEAAEDSIFDGLIASGVHTNAISHRITVENFYSDVANLGGLGTKETSFPNPVYPNDTLHVAVVIGKKRQSESDPGRGIVEIERRTVNQHGDEVMRSTNVVLVERVAGDGAPAE